MEKGSKNSEQKELPKLQSSNFAAGAETGGAKDSDGQGEKGSENRSDPGDLSGRSFTDVTKPTADREAFRSELEKRQMTPEHQKGGDKFSTEKADDSRPKNEKIGEK